MGDREQAFERHPKLARWIEKLANRRIEGFSHASWCAFLSEINTALDAEAGPPERGGWREMAETAARALAEIPTPRVNDGAHVVWAVGDDVPESIAVAQSYIAAMLSAAPKP